ncbi:MAG: U32 family peptidase [Lachnospiraceae bacterium]|nr:U32 family peptidase [Lachnospiraceae bacterium]
MRRPELLLPAKDPEVLRTAVRYGADAVYIGGEAYGLRAKARNFSAEEMAESIRYAHERGVKVYVTANILAHNSDLSGAGRYFEQLAEMKPDAILVADPGMFMLAREKCPNVPLHISTQANNTNYGTFNFWFGLGAERVVCARELSLKEIAQIRRNIPQDREIEAFIHGAMCISYSGRCLLSNYFTGRDANHGACTHPCRWKYAVMEESRPGVYLPVEENERGTFVFNSRDLCMIEHIPDLIRAGVDSFKIEGRMKTALYVASVARAYRQAIDDFLESEELYESRIPQYQDAIRKCTYRKFTTGFYYGRPGEEAMVYDSNTYVNEAVFLGIVEEITPKGLARIMQRNKFCVGDRIEIMKPDGRDIPVIVAGMYDCEGTPRESAPHPKEIMDLDLRKAGDPLTGADVETGDVLRVVMHGTGEEM